MISGTRYDDIVLSDTFSVYLIAQQCQRREKILVLNRDVMEEKSKFLKQLREIDIFCVIKGCEKRTIHVFMDIVIKGRVTSPC